MGLSKQNIENINKAIAEITRTGPLVNRDTTIKKGINALFDALKELDPMQFHEARAHVFNEIKKKKNPNLTWISMAKRDRIEDALNNNPEDIAQFYNFFQERIVNAAMGELQVIDPAQVIDPVNEKNESESTIEVASKLQKIDGAGDDKKNKDKSKSKRDALHALIAVYRHTIDERVREETGLILRNNLSFLITDAPFYYKEENKVSQIFAAGGHNAGDLTAKSLIALLDLSNRCGLNPDAPEFKHWTPDMWVSVTKMLVNNRKDSRLKAYFAGDNAAEKMQYFYMIYGPHIVGKIPFASAAGNLSEERIKEFCLALALILKVFPEGAKNSYPFLKETAEKLQSYSDIKPDTSMELERAAFIGAKSYGVEAKEQAAKVVQEGELALSPLSMLTLGIKPILEKTPSEMANEETKKALQFNGIKRMLTEPTPEEGDDAGEINSFKELFKYIEAILKENPNNKTISLKEFVRDRFTEDFSAVTAGMQSYLKDNLPELLLLQETTKKQEQKLGILRQVYSVMAQLDINFPLIGADAWNTKQQKIANGITAIERKITEEKEKLNKETEDLTTKAGNLLDRVDEIKKSSDCAAVEGELNNLKEELGKMRQKIDGIQQATKTGKGESEEEEKRLKEIESKIAEETKAKEGVEARIKEERDKVSFDSEGQQPVKTRQELETYKKLDKLRGDLESIKNTLDKYEEQKQEIKGRIDGKKPEVDLFLLTYGCNMMLARAEQVLAEVADKNNKKFNALKVEEGIEGIKKDLDPLVKESEEKLANLNFLNKGQLEEVLQRLLATQISFNGKRLEIEPFIKELDPKETEESSSKLEEMQKTIKKNIEDVNKGIIYLKAKEEDVKIGKELDSLEMEVIQKFYPNAPEKKELEPEQVLLLLSGKNSEELKQILTWLLGKKEEFEGKKTAIKSNEVLNEEFRKNLLSTLEVMQRTLNSNIAAINGEFERLQSKEEEERISKELVSLSTTIMVHALPDFKQNLDAIKPKLQWFLDEKVNLDAKEKEIKSNGKLSEEDKGKLLSTLETARSGLETKRQQIASNRKDYIEESLEPIQNLLSTEIYKEASFDVLQELKTSLESARLFLLNLMVLAGETKDFMRDQTSLLDTPKAGEKMLRDVEEKEKQVASTKALKDEAEKEAAKKISKELDSLATEITTQPLPDFNKPDQESVLKLFSDQRTGLDNIETTIKSSKNLNKEDREELLSRLKSLRVVLNQKMEEIALRRKDYINAIITQIQELLDTAAYSYSRLDILQKLQTSLNKIIDSGVLNDLITFAEKTKDFMGTKESLLDIPNAGEGIKNRLEEKKVQVERAITKNIKTGGKKPVAQIASPEQVRAEQVRAEEAQDEKAQTEAQAQAQAQSQAQAQAQAGRAQKIEYSGLKAKIEFGINALNEEITKLKEDPYNKQSKLGDLEIKRDKMYKDLALIAGIGDYKPRLRHKKSRDKNLEDMRASLVKVYNREDGNITSSPEREQLNILMEYLIEEISTEHNYWKSQVLIMAEGYAHQQKTKGQKNNERIYMDNNQLPSDRLKRAIEREGAGDEGNYATRFIVSKILNNFECGAGCLPEGREQFSKEANESFFNNLMLQQGGVVGFIEGNKALFSLFSVFYEINKERNSIDPLDPEVTEKKRAAIAETLAAEKGKAENNGDKFDFGGYDWEQRTADLEGTTGYHFFNENNDKAKAMDPMERYFLALTVLNTINDHKAMLQKKGEKTLGNLNKALAQSLTVQEFSKGQGECPPEIEALRKDLAIILSQAENTAEQAVSARDLKKTPCAETVKV